MDTGVNFGVHGHAVPATEPGKKPSKQLTWEKMDIFGTQRLSKVIVAFWGGLNQLDPVIASLRITTT